MLRRLIVLAKLIVLRVDGAAPRIVALFKIFESWRPADAVDGQGLASVTGQVVTDSLVCCMSVGVHGVSVLLFGQVEALLFSVEALVEVWLWIEVVIILLLLSVHLQRAIIMN